MKMAERTEAMKAPTEPFDGFLIEGFGVSDRGVPLVAEADRVGAVVIPAKLMDGSSAIIAVSKPAHPN